MSPFIVVADALDRLARIVVAAETFSVQGDAEKRDKALQQASELAVDALEFLPAARDPMANVFTFTPRGRPSSDQPKGAA